MEKSADKINKVDVNHITSRCSPPVGCSLLTDVAALDGLKPHILTNV